ncbi:putative mucin TcMUCII [Trypanosoma cruzi]|uniref:Mucin TcMUCII, putative n=2 Tax=Trypanosoma cruzi TaxID=5693 RepID=Q4DFV7_TRYCC|nr:mucin TcMUCII, putative [Trypanosoma cruzi]EAN91404.1 mucin TcMUCII, putative [Trypanosoma cruzi]PWV14205.1 putative mucin TcMUCII [Trypanosoma cruzi]RNC38667.1 mucin TcMUCII [Trypanosoma cruzi]|eukprot:XP_813255.1 mucin TcMUCII [Trypanosoma cruzi strain CL Brener]
MMMTCRLLCALLLLALCCYPFLCVAQDPETVDVEVSAKTNTTPTTQLPDSKTNVKPEVDVKGTGVNSSPPESGGQGKGQSQPAAQPVPKPAGSPGKDTGAVQSLTDTTPISEGVVTALQKQGDKGTTVSQSGHSISEEQADMNSKASAETTTTTTAPGAPTTTTTTTTTEAPTTTTTRAPSRLREVDGSLSSSAWVCAPLLLAASALAYTAVG